MESLSVFKQIIDIFSALLSPVIAISVAFIAFQQWKLNAIKERRESGQQKLQIYMVVKKFLIYVDVNRVLYEELQEALASADFFFNDNVTDWLYEIDCASSACLNLVRINSLKNSERDNPEHVRNMNDIEDLIDELQTFHCQLFDVFKSSMAYLQTNKVNKRLS